MRAAILFDGDMNGYFSSANASAQFENLGELVKNTIFVA